MLCCAFPIAVNLMMLMCNPDDIYSLMVYSFASVLLAPIVIYEALPRLQNKLVIVKKSAKIAILVLLSIVVLCYAHLDNGNYTAAYYATEQTKNYFNSMVVQIRMTQGFTVDKKWVFVGELNDPQSNNAWQQVPLYEGVLSSKDLVTAASWPAWLWNYTGIGPIADEAITGEMSTKQEVKDMACWPNYGSIKAIDDYIVVKLSD